MTSPRRVPKKHQSSAFERAVLYAAALLAFLFAGYALRSAKIASEETAAFRAAEPLPAATEARELGRLYRTEGLLTGQMVTPPEFPMVREAIQVTAVKETRESAAAAAWKPKTSGDGKEKTFMANELTIGGAPFMLGGGTRIVAPVSEDFLAQSELMRVRVRWLPSAGKTFTAYGIWNGAALGDSTAATGMLVERGREAEALAAVGLVADRRVQVNVGVAVLLVILGIGTAWSAWRASKLGAPKGRGGSTLLHAGIGAKQ